MCVCVRERERVKGDSRRQKTVRLKQGRTDRNDCFKKKIQHEGHSLNIENFIAG